MSVWHPTEDKMNLRADKVKVIMTEYFKIYSFNNRKLSIKCAVQQWKQVCSSEATNIRSK